MSEPTRDFAPRAYRRRRATSRCAAVVLLTIVLISTTCGVAFGVVGGKTVSIKAAPWTVVVWEPNSPGHPRYAACTGVIIDTRQILTAGHCVMSGNSAEPMSASAFTIEAGASDFKHALKTDHPQFREVSGVRVMPGYIAGSKITDVNDVNAEGHDLAVLTLSRPLDLNGDDARAAYLPSTHTREPSRKTTLVMAGFGSENPNAAHPDANGTLNEVTKSTVPGGCSTTQVLCMYLTTDTCWGDSGSGAVEPGPRPTVVGILSAGLNLCQPGADFYVSLTAPAALRFVKTST